jgi:hypothetical protein
LRDLLLLLPRARQNSRPSDPQAAPSPRKRRLSADTLEQMDRVPRNHHTQPILGGFKIPPRDVNLCAANQKSTVEDGNPKCSLGEPDPTPHEHRYWRSLRSRSPFCQRCMRCRCCVRYSF